MRRLAEALQPHVWVNVHSGMEALFMPYDHKATIPGGQGGRVGLAGGRVGGRADGQEQPLTAARRVLLSAV